MQYTSHLGNVLAVVNDAKYYNANPAATACNFDVIITASQDYFPFGMQIPERSFNSDTYRFGFNGKEYDNEVYGDGNFQDYGMRMYDTRVGRWMSVDPLTNKYPDVSPYCFTLNNPIIFVDVDGEKVGLWYQLLKIGTWKSVTDYFKVRKMIRQNDFGKQEWKSLKKENTIFLLSTTKDVLTVTAGNEYFIVGGTTCYDNTDPSKAKVAEIIISLGAYWLNMNIKNTMESNPTKYTDRNVALDDIRSDYSYSTLPEDNYVMGTAGVPIEGTDVSGVRFQSGVDESGISVPYNENENEFGGRMAAHEFGHGIGDDNIYRKFNGVKTNHSKMKMAEDNALEVEKKWVNQQNSQKHEKH